jgi:site-specific DNA-methyltransferase (adenine-specific)
MELQLTVLFLIKAALGNTAKPSRDEPIFMKPHFKSKDDSFRLYSATNKFALGELATAGEQVDLVYADPPYFLSSGGMTIESGKMVSVNKAAWDKSKSYSAILDFNYEWISDVRKVMADDATIWISGTKHNIFTIMQCIHDLDFKILNFITWQKTNPPPTFWTQIFKHSTEFIVFARKHHQMRHHFNEEVMKDMNGGKRFSDVWTMPSIQKFEKSQGKHPTQKPLGLLSRIIQSSSRPNGLILDPFSGSGTTGIAANLLGRRYIGIDRERKYHTIAKNRYNEVQNSEGRSAHLEKLALTNVDSVRKKSSKTRSGRNKGA